MLQNIRNVININTLHTVDAHYKEIRHNEKFDIAEKSRRIYTNHVYITKSFDIIIFIKFNENKKAYN